MRMDPSSRPAPVMALGARVSEHSPQPVMPSSVSTFTKVHARQPASTMNVSSLVIFISLLSRYPSLTWRAPSGVPLRKDFSRHFQRVFHMRPTAIPSRLGEYLADLPLGQTGVQRVGDMPPQLAHVLLTHQHRQDHDHALLRIERGSRPYLPIEIAIHDLR